MPNPSPPTSSPRWRWFVLLSSLMAFIGTVALMLRRRKWSAMTTQPEPDFSTETTSSTSAEVDMLPVPPSLSLEQAAPVPLPPNLQLLSPLGLIVGVALCGVGLFLIQDVAPDIATLLFKLLLAIAGLLILFLYRQQIVTVLLSPFRVLIRFYTMDRVVAHVQPGQHHTHILSIAVSLLMACALLLVVVLLPVSPQLGLVLFLALVGIIYFTRRSFIDPLIIVRRYIAYLKAAPVPESSILPVVTIWTVINEWMVIVVVTMLVTRVYQLPQQHIQFSGNEAEWLTSSAYTAVDGLRQYGRIPLWQPYLESGEPFVENPFAFIFNPFTSLPSFIWGAPVGLRVSAIISVLLTGLGGWFLGWILGLKTLGRILLALLLMGKGNMHAMLGSGYFQLALSQVYMPWVIGGIIAIIRLPRHRWPIVLTALFSALLFFTGNLWYVLPTGVGALCVAFPLVINWGQRRIKFAAIGRLLLAALMAVGLAAVTLVPVALHFDRIGKHPPEFEAGWSVPLEDVIPLYFDPAVTRRINIFFPETRVHWQRPVKATPEFYYSFVTPDWFLLLLLIVPFYRPSVRWERRLWLVALALVFLATVWGAGGNPVFIWLYRTFPALAQWRFVGRALAVASFWIAVLVALRIDSLWNIAFQTDWNKLGIIRPIARRLPVLLGAGLLLSGGLVAVQVNSQWDQLEVNVRPIDAQADKCINWLRQSHPDRPLSVWQFNYRHITAFLNNHVRSWDIQADFEMRHLPSTIGQSELNLNEPYPEFAFIDQKHERQVLIDIGYLPLAGSPLFDGTYHCLYRNTKIIPYAYTIAWNDLFTLRMPYPTEKLEVPPQIFTPVTLLEHQPDSITVRVDSPRNRKLVLGVQERSYPGWQVTINGQPAQLESVGGQIGVFLPLGAEPLVVTFVYRPPLVMIGGSITIATSALCAIYLLRGRRKKSATM